MDETLVNNFNIKNTNEDNNQSNNSKRTQNEFFSWIKAFILAVFIILILHFLGFTSVQVNGISMEPTLHDGDKIILYDLFYEPEINDIIVFRPQHRDELYVKRVVAKEGQTVNVDYDNNKVIIDGKELDDEFSLNMNTMDTNIDYPITVPKDKYFVLGDNRDHSADSRNNKVGLVDKEDIIGKVFIRFWPLNKLRIF